MPDDPVSDGQGGDDPPVAGPSTTRPPMTSTESSQHVPSSSDIEAMLDSRRKTRKFRDMMFGKRTAAKSQFDTYRAERLSTGSTEGDPVLDEEEAGPLPSSRDETSQPHPGIEITESGREASNEEYDGDPMSHLDIPDKGIFVWDVLFENQRGIFLLGKGYFSSRTLLPADPSPFTVPSHSLPSASSITVGQANPDPQEPNMEHSRQSPTAVQAGTVYQSGTRNASDTRDTEPKAGTEGVKDRPIETGYTLETFQTPSPAWSWITPWMINMRTGADESGWRYNGWFRKKGWKSHAGPAGFNGWVRRREWVRLRGILPPKEDSDSLLEMENEKYKEKEDEKGEVGDKYEAKSLKEVLGGEEDEADEVLLKLMGQIPLDRERLHRWEAWLDKSDEEDKRVLTEYIATPESVSVRACSTAKKS